MSHATNTKPGSIVKVIAESQVALQVVNALISRSAPLCAEVRRLYVVVQRLGITLDAERIPTAANVWADKLRRTKGSTEWILARNNFALLDSMHGPHLVDRFATWKTKIVPRYNSENLDPGRAPVDAMEQDWREVNNGAGPPFGKIPLMLNLIKDQAATATVVVSVWTALPLSQPALEAAHEICYLPRQAGVYFSGADGAVGHRPHWRVAALRFIRGWRGQPQGHG